MTLSDKEMSKIARKTLEECGHLITNCDKDNIKSLKETLSDKRLMINKSAFKDMHAGYISRIFLEEDVKEFIKELKKSFLMMEQSGFIAERGEMGWDWEEEIDKLAGADLK